MNDGEFIIQTKQPYARSHFFIDEELSSHEEHQVKADAQFIDHCQVEEEKVRCVV